MEIRRTLLVLLLLTAGATASADERIEVQVVRGRVVDLEGRPVPDARVVISTRVQRDRGRDSILDPGGDPVRLLERTRAAVWHRAIFDLCNTRTDRNGSFQARLDPPRSDLNEVTATATTDDGSASGTTGALPIRPGHWIGGIGRVVAHEVHYPAEVLDGVLDLGIVLVRPLARLRVEVSAGGQPSAGAAVYFRRPGIGQEDQVVVAADNDGVVSAIFPAGPIRVDILSDRMGPRARTVALVAAAGDQTVQLELAQVSCGLRGHVVDADGRPVPKALILALPTTRMNDIFRERDLALSSARSDESGAFVLSDGFGAPIVLVASVPGTSRRAIPITAAPGTSPVLALAPEGFVEVEVPTGVALIYDTRTDILGGEAGYGQELKVRDAPGRLLRLDGIPAGRVQFVGEGVSMSLWATAPIDVERGQVVRAAFEPGLVVRGRVVDSQGRGRYAGLECRASEGGRPWLLGGTNDDGSFVVTVPATFELRAERSDFWTSVERVVQHSPWVPAASAAVELHLEAPPAWAMGRSLSEQYLER